MSSYFRCWWSFTSFYYRSTSYQLICHFIFSYLWTEKLKMFDRFLFCLCLWRLLGVFGADEVKSVMEGESVTLNITVTEIKDINMIMWKSNKSLIAKISRAFSKITVYDNDTDGRFRDRLKLDNQTGSLIITDTRTTDSGEYEVTIISSEMTTYTFRVTVFAATTPDPQTPPQSPSPPPSQSPSGSPSYHTSVSLIVLISAAAAGSLVIVAVIVMFCICRKHRDSVHEDETQAAAKLYKHTVLMKESDVTEQANPAKMLRTFKVVGMSPGWHMHRPQELLWPEVG
uniref:Immunoglobulin domain-containing protein n=1 Tax=Cyprinus carpio TaxID=7962 RepID=A0A8C1Y999_CYPCA